MNIKLFSFHRMIGCLVILTAFNLEDVNMAWAQPMLERLENQIRQHVSPSQDSSPPGRTSTIPPPGIEPRTNRPFISQSPQISSSYKAPATYQPGPGYLGVVADDRNDRGRGVRITEVRRGSPAEKAGLRRQDLITALAGTRIRQLSEMTDILKLYPAGDVVEFDILREGIPLQTKAILGQRPSGSPDAGQGPEIIPLPPGELIVPQQQSNKPFAAVGKTAGQSDREKIDVLQQQVGELERRVAELERALTEAEKKK